MQQKPLSTAVLCTEAAADLCYVCGVQLVAVQPACLKANAAAPGDDGLQLQGGWQPHAALHPQQQEHDLLLHLEAVLLHSDSLSISVEQDVVLQAVTAATAAAAGVAHPGNVTPMPLQKAMLEVVLLGRRMKLIQQQHHSLLQLILQQQDQQQHVGQYRVASASAASTSSSSIESGCAQTSVSASLMAGSIKQATAQQTDSTSTVGAVQQSEAPPPSQASSTHTWTVCLNLHITFPYSQAAWLLDSLHLVMLVRTTTAQQQQHIEQAATSCTSNSSDLAVLQPAPALVAEVPLLVLPAVAQQEVQQLLLPAMRQDVQVEQQQQQQAAATSDNTLGSHMQVESAVWRHFSQLANDIHTVLQLVSNSEATSAAEPTDPATPESSTGSPTVTIVPVAMANPEAAVVTAAAVAPDPQAPSIPTAAEALADVAQNLLFPLLLPFLAAHGLHNLLQLLISCLPQQLQQQWEQQQQERLGVLGQVAPAATQLLPEGELARDVTLLGTLQVSAGAETAGTDKHAAVTSAAAAEPQQVFKPAAVLVAAEQADGIGRQQYQNTKAAGDSDLHKRPARSAVAVTATQQQELPAAGAGVSSTAAWYVPLTQFEPETERRYVEWKHQNLLNLDYLGALFAVMYVAVLLRKLMREPATLFYLMYISIKTLPHVPLILGYREAYLRHREKWLFLVAPGCLLLTWAFSMHSIVHGQPAMLLPNRAYKAYWSSRGELATSAMRPFAQHMRLRQYTLYCLLDGAISAWVFGQVFGVWAAAQRWSVAVGMSVAIGWAFEYYMRRRFVVCESGRYEHEQRLLTQQQQKVQGFASSSKEA